MVSRDFSIQYPKFNPDKNYSSNNLNSQVEDPSDIVIFGQNQNSTDFNTENMGIYRQTVSAADGIREVFTPTSPEYYRDIKNGNYTQEDYVKIKNTTHLRYADANPADLVTVNNGIKVHKDAAKAFSEMQAAAKKDGINLTIVSGNRTIAYQKQVFPRGLKNKTNPTNEDFERRALVSAPPGFSEHHTGYALDLNSTEENYWTTSKGQKEYKWLQEHAAEYGFVQSFPQNNAQGVAREDWHWRFQGTTDAQNTFKAANTYFSNN